MIYSQRTAFKFAAKEQGNEEGLLCHTLQHGFVGRKD